MTTLDEAIVGTEPAPETSRTVVRSERKCRRHDYVYGGPLGDFWLCRLCRKPKDEIRSRRGKTNRSRGNAIELEVCRKLGITRVGHHGTETDGGTSDDWIRVQVKSGGAYPARIDQLLRALPVTASQLRAVVHATAEGPGHRRRALVTLDLDEFADWFGKGGQDR